MTNDWLRPDATVVPVDYATYCAAEVARDAALFLVDQREQYLANRDAGNFDGYPDPTATIGEAILAGTARPRRAGSCVTPPRRRASRTSSSPTRSSDLRRGAGLGTTCLADDEPRSGRLSATACARRAASSCDLVRLLVVLLVRSSSSRSPSSAARSRRSAAGRRRRHDRGRRAATRP